MPSIKEEIDKIEKQNNFILQKIKESFDKKTLIPFIGAGFSKNIDKKYTDYEELINSLGADIGIKKLYNSFNKQPLEAMEYYILRKGEKEWEDGNVKLTQNKGEDIFIAGKRKFLEKLKEIFTDKYKARKWELHDLVVKKFSIIYTTNWDDILEKSRRKKSFVIYSKSHLKESSKETKNRYVKIIKFHGDYRSPETESLIVCQYDYLKRICEENPFDVKFKNDLLHYDFLFIGYSFNDPTITLWLNQIFTMMSDVYPEHKTNIFWIAIEHFSDRRIELFKKRYNILPYFLLFDEYRKHPRKKKVNDKDVKKEMKKFLDYL